MESIAQFVTGFMHSKLYSDRLTLPKGSWQNFAESAQVSTLDGRGQNSAKWGRCGVTKM